jgi:hypothetical protein
LTAIEIALSPKEHFEDNISKFILLIYFTETITNAEKPLFLLNILRQVDKHKHYRERPLNVCVVDLQKEN